MWALRFFVIAIIAAVFGFTDIAAGAADVARILFFLFIVLFLVSIVVHGVHTTFRGEPPV
jgi:uncharacterized membrane protein YtjA (UPF0391 family)